MPRGGKRPNAGRPSNAARARKPGAATTKTRAIANEAASDGGKLPLQVMLANMRHWQAEAEAAEAVLAELHVKNPTDEDAVQIIKAAVKKAVGYREMATKAADSSARFLHPILSPVDGKPRDNEFVPLADRLKAYETRDAIEKSGGKVVELKRKGKKS